MSTIQPAASGAAPAAQPEVRTRSRIQPTASAAPATRAAPATAHSNDTSWMKQGAAAHQAQAQEMERQKRLAEERAKAFNMPLRYWLGAPGQGDILLLDADIGPCFYEHGLRDSKGKFGNLFEACPKEWEPCPLCEADGKESYYVMMLSCIDMRSYTNRQNVVIPHSRKLLPVKAQEQGFFMRLMERHGSLRGIHLLMARDNQNSPSIGRAEFIAKYTEEDILASFGHPERRDPKDATKIVKAANADCYPFEYGKLFHRPSAADLRARYGGTAPAGSAQQFNTTFQQGGAPATTQQGAPASAPAATTAPAGGATRIQPRTQGATQPGGELDDIPL